MIGRMMRIDWKPLVCLLWLGIVGWLGGLLPCELQAAEELATLRGTVTDVAGNPLVSVRVSLNTAAPKTGPRFLCPSCYADCGKATLTQPDGTFEINQLDPSLRFEVLCVGEGLVARFVPKVDPSAGPIETQLEALDLTGVPDEFLISGRIVDSFGDGIAHAVVTVSARTRGDRTSWGGLQGFMATPVAVSDEEGRFLMVAEEPFDVVELAVSARNFADHHFPNVPSGKKDRRYALPRGGTLSGRVIHEGEPVAGITVEIASDNRTMGAGFYQTAVPTDDEGIFHFYNLPPNKNYLVTASMEAIRHLGITPIERVNALQDEQVVSLGDLVVEPGLILSGVVATSDGEAIPEDSVIYLSHAEIWKGQSVVLPPDGRFRFEGLHPGDTRMSLTMPNYHFSPRNRSFTGQRGRRLAGTLTHSRNEVELLVEPGPYQGNERLPDFMGQEFVTRRPFRGGEPLSRSEQAASVTVVVRDAQSGDRISDYQITPGWLFEGGQHPVWHHFQSRRVNGSSGSVGSMVLAKRSGSAHVLVEAKDYLPETVAVEGQFGERIEVALRLGRGLNGVVRSPDGTPAASAVVLITKTWPNSERPYLVFVEEGQFRSDTLQQHEHQRTDREGHFQFSPRAGNFPILVAHPTGFAALKTLDATAPVDLVLEPWSRIDGVIEAPFAPDLRLGIHRMAPLAAPPKNTSLWQRIVRKVGLGRSQARSSFWDFIHVAPKIEREDDGPFRLSFIPAGRWSVNLMRFVPSEDIVGASEGRTVRKSEAVVKPGETKSVFLSGSGSNEQ